MLMHENTTLATLAMVVLGVGCTVESSDNNPFGTATTPNTAPPATSDPGTDGSGGSGSSSEGGSSSDGADGSTTTPVTTGPMSTTTSVSVGESSSSDDGGNGMQPAMGMYSFCTVPTDCEAGTNLCITLGASGFCTLTGCANPVLDCDPNPGGTATPVCVPVDVGGMAESACALDCTGGASCPPPMTCQTNIMGLRDLCF
ncbi:MAG: hypothetical protein KDK70_22280 [Myxococcales bacterium]|nr:hypothetical protein [Myxococcales bacterium]